MASAAAVTTLGLLHMRLLQHWLHSRVPRWAWHHGTVRMTITPTCCHSFSPWTDLDFLCAGVPLEQVSRHVVVMMDASSVGWCVTCYGQAASGVWTGPRLLWHINCLELLEVLLALRRFRRLLLGKHVLVHTVNTATVSYINWQGCLRSRCMSQLTHHLLLWSQTRRKLLRTIHIPGKLNRAADVLSRELTFPREWRLHPETAGCIVLAHTDLVFGTHAPRDKPSRHIPLRNDLLSQRLGTIGTGGGRHYHSGQSPLYEASSCLEVESVCDLVFFSPRRPPKMHDWSVVLSFLQERLEHRLSPSTLKVYVAAIAAHHDAVDGRSLGKHKLIVRFLKGARKLNPPRPPLVPS